MGYRGIIFDFNGVLLWDSHLHEQAWREFARQLRGTPFTQEEMAHYMHGRSNHTIVEYLIGRSISFADAQALAQQKEAIYRQMCLEMGTQFQLSPGAMTLLDKLVTRKVPHTIATASEIENLRFFIEHLHLERWFDLDRIVYDDGSFPMKPAPDIYEHAAARLDLEPAKCVVIEDSRSGIAAAHAAGIGHIIGIGPASTHAQLQELPGVEATITDLGQFAAALPNLFDFDW